jgi:hypothetical protein
MEFNIKVEGEEDLRSLCGWLTDEPAVRRVVLAGPPPQPGEQGTVFDVVQAVLSDGFALASLVVAIKQWQQSRPRAPVAIVRGTDGEMTTVEPGAAGDGSASQP